MKAKNSVLFCFIILMSFQKFSQDTIVYKTLDTLNLYLEVYRPHNFDKEKSYPAMVFFFGGGWVNGGRGQFLPHALHFAERGAISFLVDYRVKNKHNTTPFESLADAKSAMRFIRKHAKQLGVDPNKIVALGGSAGGQLAAACAMTNGFDDSLDDLSISPVPNALVLYNPVADNGPGGFGYNRIGEAYKDFSPLHNVQGGNPPTISFLGTKDALIPVETLQYFKAIMERVGSRSDLHLYKNQEHGFFNRRRSIKFYKKTLRATDEFVQSIGFIAKSKSLEIK